LVRIFWTEFLQSIVNLVVHHSPVAQISSSPLLSTATLSPGLPTNTSTSSLKLLSCLLAVTVMFMLNMAKSGTYLDLYFDLSLDLYQYLQYSNILSNAVSCIQLSQSQTNICDNSRLNHLSFSVIPRLS